jgi:hypothetical protein
VESLNRVLRKTLKTKGSFPTEEAATKLIFLAIRNFEKGGRAVREWVAARNQLAIIVTSREVVRLLSEQLRFEFVPVLHRLQGRLAAQG